MNIEQLNQTATKIQSVVKNKDNGNYIVNFVNGGSIQTECENLRDALFSVVTKKNEVFQTLSFEQRPFGCQVLVPKENKKCVVECKEETSNTIWDQWSLQAGFMKDLRDSLWDDFENKGNQNV